MFCTKLWVPYIFWILAPYLKYGLQIHRLSFHFLLQSLVLCNPSYVFLLLLSVLLASYLKQIPKVSISTWRFTILGLIFVSFLCFNLCVVQRPILLFLYGAYPIFPIQIIEEIIFFLHCVSIAPLLKIN